MVFSVLGANLVVGIWDLGLKRGIRSYGYSAKFNRSRTSRCQPASGAIPAGTKPAGVFRMRHTTRNGPDLAGKQRQNAHLYLDPAFKALNEYLRIELGVKHYLNGDEWQDTVPHYTTAGPNGPRLGVGW
jgi:hypothetical protein